MDDFSLARLAGHRIMGDGSGPDGRAKNDGAKALSGAASVDTATTQVDQPSRTKNLIIEYEESLVLDVSIHMTLPPLSLCVRSVALRPEVVFNLAACAATSGV